MLDDNTWCYKFDAPSKEVRDIGEDCTYNSQCMMDCCVSGKCVKSDVKIDLIDGIQKETSVTLDDPDVECGVGFGQKCTSSLHCSTKCCQSTETAQCVFPEEDDPETDGIDETGQNCMTS